MVGHLADIITCAKFQNDIFMGYDFTGGRISHFPIDFCMGLIQQCSATALPVMRSFTVGLFEIIGVARILSAGVHFFTKKVLLWLGVHFVSCGGALTHFSCKLGLKNFFSPPWGCRCTHCTPWLRLCLKSVKSCNYGCIVTCCSSRLSHPSPALIT